MGGEKAGFREEARSTWEAGFKLGLERWPWLWMKGLQGGGMVNKDPREVEGQDSCFYRNSCTWTWKGSSGTVWE